MYTHTHIHTSTHAYIHPHTHTYIHTHIHTYVHIHTSTQTYIYTNIHPHTNIHTSTHTYIHPHTHTYICTHIHTCSSTQKWKYWLLTVYYLVGNKKQQQINKQPLIKLSHCALYKFIHFFLSFILLCMYVYLISTCLAYLWLFNTIAPGKAELPTINVPCTCVLDLGIYTYGVSFGS